MQNTFLNIFYIIFKNIRNYTLEKDKEFLHKFNDLKYFDDKMEYIYKCYERKLISLSIYYYNYLLNYENKENYIYHLNRLINKVDYNTETYINKDYGYIINSLGEQRKDCVLHI